MRWCGFCDIRLFCFNIFLLSDRVAHGSVLLAGVYLLTGACCSWEGNTIVEPRQALAACEDSPKRPETKKPEGISRGNAPGWDTYEKLIY